MYTTPDDVIEQAAKSAAILGDYDGCFERIDAWGAATDDERLDLEEPLSTDEEDCEFWRNRIAAGAPLIDRAALKAAREKVATRAGSMPLNWPQVRLLGVVMRTLDEMIGDDDE